METTKRKNNKSIIEEYNSIVNSSRSTVINKTEWFSIGDTFQKFSTYESYTPVKTSGETTLIK